MYKFAKSLQSMKSGRSYKAGQAVPSELFDGQALDVLLADGTVIEASDPKIKKPTSIDKPADIPEALKTEYPLPQAAKESDDKLFQELKTKADKAKADLDKPKGKTK